MFHERLQRDLEPELDVSVFPRQRGVVVFCSTTPSIALIRSDDGFIFSCTDHTTLQEIAETANMATEPEVTFIPVIGMGNICRCACTVEVVRTSGNVQAAYNYAPDSPVDNHLPSPNEFSIDSLDALIQDRLYRNYEAPAQSERKNALSWLNSKEDDNRQRDRLPFGCEAPKSEAYVPAHPGNYKIRQDYLHSGIQHDSMIPIFTQHMKQSNVTYHESQRYTSSPPALAISARPQSDTINLQTVSEDKLHSILNGWYHIPEMFNKDTYPFPCEGFIVLSNTGSDLLVFTRRLGCITRKEDPNRKGRPYAYFMVCGPNDYRAWEYEDRQPATFKSTKYVNAQNIETKGYALMAPGDRNESESRWYAWNDQTGFMRCLANCARVLKKKYSTWSPTGQMVMFDAISNDNGRQWTIKTISYIDIATASEQNLFPSQAYFIEKMFVMPLEHQKDTKEEIVFYSEMLKSKVFAKIIHVREPPKNATPNESYYSGIIFTTWGHDGLGRRYEALMAAPENYWIPPRSNFADVRRKLFTGHWDRPRQPKELLEAKSQTNLSYPSEPNSKDEKW